MRVFVESHGCSTNLFEGAVLAGCLARAGFEIVGPNSSADIVVLNTCAVKQPTENRMIEIAKQVSPEKKLIIAGCLPLVRFERLQKEVAFSGAVGPAAGEKIVDVVRRVLIGEIVVEMEQSLNLPDLCLPRVQSNPVISVIPVGTGCLGSCAYCCVVFARGYLKSYPVQDIIERVGRDLDSGMREIWVTSQDTACYGKDKGTNLARLLAAVLQIEADFKVRVGMMTPNRAEEILNELIHVYRDKRIFKFIHLPVQSGDDYILQQMRRLYNVNDFKAVVEVFKAKFGNVTIATDVICGFPGEGKEAFEKTLRLLKEVKPDIVNVSKFFARPHTVAAKMQADFVPSSEIKRRSVQASILARALSFENNLHWVGWSGEILVDEVGKISGSWVGRNFAYKPIVVKSGSSLLGKTIDVRVVKACPTYLVAELI